LKQDPPSQQGGFFFFFLFFFIFFFLGGGFFSFFFRVLVCGGGFFGFFFFFFSFFLHTNTPRIKFSVNRITSFYSYVADKLYRLKMFLIRLVPFSFFLSLLRRVGVFSPLSPSCPTGTRKEESVAAASFPPPRILCGTSPMMRSQVPFLRRRSRLRRSPLLQRGRKNVIAEDTPDPPPLLFTTE